MSSDCPVDSLAPQDLPFALYLNQRLTFDVLAALEGDFAHFTTVQTTGTEETATTKSGQVGVGASHVFAFLGMQLDGQRTKQK